MSSITQEQFLEAAALVRSWRRPLLVAHQKPDGDAIGSLLALQRMLVGTGSNPKAVIFDELPHRYKGLLSFGPLALWGSSATEDDLNAADGVVILDTCTYNQLEPIAPWLRSSRKPLLVVDHHATRDAIGGLHLIDETAAATCLILFEWGRRLDWTFDPSCASALFVGIAMDTGWFRHSNCDARALAAASELARLGARPNALFQMLYEKERHGRLKLLAAALDTLELRADGRLAIMRLPKNVFPRCAATPADTEDIVNEPLRIESVVVSVLFVEQEDGVVRINLRSKEPPTPSDPEIDVAKVALRLGGGGHRRAAGARIPGALDEVYQHVICQLGV